MKAKIHKAEDPREGLRNETKKHLSSLFDEIPDGKKRNDELKKKLKSFFKEDFVKSGLGVATFASINEALDGLAQIHDKSIFIEAAASILEPLLVFRTQNLVAFEIMERKQFMEQGDYIAINDIICYMIKGGALEIHLAPARTFSSGEKWGLFREGFAALAKIVAERKDVKEITAASWIVAKRPGIFIKLGFVVEPSDGRVDKEGRPVRYAHSSRESFLVRHSEIKA